ncbi:MAG: thioesterase family protein, partial [Blautia wexlerae]
MGVYRRKAQYHETDQMGIIHHSNYVKWMEEARIDFMKELGFGYGEVEKRGIVSPVAGVSVSYKKPVLFDDVVGISVSVKKYSGVVLELAYEFFNVTRSEVCTEASSKHCFT